MSFDYLRQIKAENKLDCFVLELLFSEAAVVGLAGGGMWALLNSSTLNFIPL